MILYRLSQLWKPSHFFGLESRLWLWDCRIQLVQSGGSSYGFKRELVGPKKSQHTVRKIHLFQGFQGLQHPLFMPDQISHYLVLLGYSHSLLSPSLEGNAASSNSKTGRLNLSYTLKCGRMKYDGRWKRQSQNKDTKKLQQNTRGVVQQWGGEKEEETRRTRVCR